MHKFEFTPDDLFINRLKTYPEYNVFIYQSRMFENTKGTAGLVVYDINRSRTTNLIYPFVLSSSLRTGFKNQMYQPNVQDHSGDFQWGSAYVGGVATQTVIAPLTDYNSLPKTVIDGEVVITSSYGTESPIKRELTNVTGGYSSNYFNLYAASTGSNQASFTSAVNIQASALQNVAKKYTILSNHFNFASSSTRSRDLVADNNGINFITIPNMYYGSTIKKGSVELNYYITGSKIATCADINHNGTLIGTTGSTSGSIVGLVMYDEGIIMLTSSVNIENDNHSIEYTPSTPLSSSWLYYGTTLNDGTGSSNTLASASYDLNFKGTNYINSLTMFAHAKKGHLNHSNNPTYKDPTSTPTSTTGSGQIFSEGDANIANVVSASYVSASFEKTTYISKVHIYDEDGNLIAITSMAKPVKKTLNDEFTFKMKLDL